MIEQRLGLTARLALVGIASALVPFVMGAIVFFTLPERVAGRQADADIDEALSLASARVQERRADLAFVLARIDDARLRPLVDRGDTDGARYLVLAAWRDTMGRDADGIDVEIAPGSAAATSRPPEQLAASVVVRAGARAQTVSLVERGAMAGILRDVERARDVELAAASTAASSGSFDVLVDRSGRPTFRGDAPARSDSRLVDAASGTWLVGGVDGSSASLLLRGRGQEVQVALVMLLAAGMLCAVSMAMVMNRMLGRVADTAERMSGGDFQTRLPVVGSDGNARVARSLNELAAALQDRIGTLERTVDRLDRTLAAIDDGVCTWSKDGELETWNSGAERLTGLAERDARHGGRAVDQLRSERIRGRRRILLPVADGDAHVAVDLSVRRMRDGGYLQVFRDAAPAVSIEQARANFLVTAAHELRTPLTSILGFAATLADETLELDDSVRAIAIEQVLAEAQRLDGVVHGLFETSLLVRDKLEVSIERVLVAPIVARVVREHGLDHVVDSDGIDEDLAVRADRDAFARALGAVLDNADKYGRPPIVVTGHAVADSRVRIVVRDDGAGIPPALHDAVFEPFHRADPEMRSEVGGAGMGLYNARRLVEAMDGSLTIGRSDEEREHRGAVRGVELVFDLQRWEERAGAPADEDGSTRAAAGGARAGSA